MASPSNPAVLVLDVPLRPHELVAAWRPETRRLVLPIRERVASQQRLQVRISAVGLGVGATITGRAVGGPRAAGSALVEVAPDDARVQAMEWLVAVASGTPVPHQPRAPRLIASVPAVVQAAEGPRYMSTFTVSASGCGLTWSGSIPGVGDPLEVRFGAGREVASFCAEVCWTKPSGRPPTVGLQFAAGDKDLWIRMLANLKAAGAPPA